ncbi:unnamed protein product [Allacma fusca]|uniref:Uncharacterized protein n=1 Tax=Allacma fusca TaxID=39272 RepID=A0A8J2PF08_9HEXA|nr:unnamed protein product [Allacma fusca]
MTQLLSVVHKEPLSGDDDPLFELLKSHYNQITDVTLKTKLRNTFLDIIKQMDIENGNTGAMFKFLREQCNASNKKKTYTYKRKIYDVIMAGTVDEDELLDDKEENVDESTKIGSVKILKFEPY